VKKTCYIHRPVLNAEEILDWYRAQGFESLTIPEDLHCTQVYSKAPVDWGFGTHAAPIIVRGGPRSLERFGDSAIVMEFKSEALDRRHKQLLTLGCSSDFPDYRSHITLTYNDGGLDLAKVEPWPHDIVLGAEHRDEIKDWTPVEKSNMLVKSAVVANLSMLVKAKPVGADNRRLVEIQSSVEAVDQEGDLILQSALMGSKDKFIQHGVLDIDHLFELGEQYGIPDPDSWKVGRPLDVWTVGKETWVLGEIYAQPDGKFDPDNNKADALWASLTGNPPVEWRSSVFGYVGQDTIDCREGFCPTEGVSRYLVKTFDWCSLAFTRSPVNDGIKNAARVVAAKSFLTPEKIALAKAGQSSLTGLFDPAPNLKQAGWIQNPARPSMDSVRTSFACPNCGGLRDAPNMPVLKAHFVKCAGLEPEDAEICAHAAMYHHLLGKAGYLMPGAFIRATGEGGARPPMIYGPGNESLDPRHKKLGQRGNS